MKRLHLVEIHDQGWFPCTMRDAETDYLQFVIAKTQPYGAIVPLLAAALERTGARHVLDLCSGAAGPWLWLQPALAERGVNVSVCLSDKYPNHGAASQVDHGPYRGLRYLAEPVDAERVPDELTGFRTIFSAFQNS